MLKHIPFYASLLGKDLGNNNVATTGHVLLYGAIEVHSWGELGCIASNETLAKETGLTKGTVAVYLSEIVNGKWVGREMTEQGERKEIIPFLKIADPLTTVKGGFNSSLRGVKPQLNIDNILGNSKISAQSAEPIVSVKEEDLYLDENTKPARNKVSPQISEVFDLFDNNPARKMWGFRSPQYKASKLLLEKYDITKLRSRLAFARKDEKRLEKHVEIHSPNQFLEKMLQLEKQYNRV